MFVIKKWRTSRSTRTETPLPYPAPCRSARVRDGDRIGLDVPGRGLHLRVDAKELDARRAAWMPPVPAADRGFVKLYVETVRQADTGADLDFLVGRSVALVPRDGP